MKKALTIIVAIMALLSFSACSSSGGNVKIGVIGPLTGDYSLYGVAVKQGAELAMEEINANGGVLGLDGQVIAYDSKGDGTEGVNAYNRLLNEDEITALVGATFSGVTLAIKDLAVSDGVPVLTPTATHPEVTLNAENVFRACYTDSYQGSVAAVFASDSLSVEKAAVLYNKDDAYSEGLAMAFIEEFEASGEVVITEAYSAGDDDYSSLLTKIAATDAEAVFLPGYVAEVGAVLTQAKDLGMTVPFIGGDGWDGIEDDYAEVADGYYFGSHYSKADEAEVVQNFISAYEAKYNESPNSLAALAYDAVYAMANAIEEAGSTEYAKVVSELASLKFENAVTGSIQFDFNGDPVKSISMIQLLDGEHVLVDKVEAK
ncbi:ABC transporter substrate-binding protein [Mycoplasmatota bacterium zrk1]